MADLDIINKIFNEILYLYDKRRKTQEDIAEIMNSKYHTTLTRNLVGEITRKNGYRNTIKRTENKPLFIKVSRSLKEALESARYPGE